MTSIASYLASLTGAAPQEGQQAALANATGGAGLFAALLDAPGALQDIDVDTSEFPAVIGNEPAANHFAALREALANGLGLPDDGVDIEAAIIEDGTVPDEFLPLSENQLGDEGPATQTEAAPGQAPVQSVAPEAGLIPENTGAAPLLQDHISQVAAQPGQRNGTVETLPRTAGLENALDKANPNGLENGLKAALSRAAQARGPGETGQPVAPQGEDGSEAPRFEAAGARDEMASIKPGASRSDFAPKGADIIQRLIRTGTGQPAIQIQERTAGETVSASSPPTLTVSVQAPAASPGPASANAPHVPVSALAVHIAQQASNGARRFDIRLDPPELGRIEVRLDVSRDGQVMTHLVVERSETLDLLQRDARQLERALQNAGLDLSEGDMKFSLKDQGLAKGGGDQFDTGDNKGGPAGAGEDNDSQPIADDAMPPPTRYLATSGLDIRI